MEKKVEKNNLSLNGQEAIEKLQELIKHESICLFCTELTKEPINTRPMGTRKVDKEGNIWFLSSLKSEKNSEILHNSNVQLFYANPGSSEYLSVFGYAILLKDKQKIEELWTPFANAWFEHGKDDVDVTAIKVVPKEAYYWDTKNNKIISMLKMLVAKVTGSTPNDGVEGTLKIK